MGIPQYIPRSLESALLLADNASDEDIVALALGLYGLYRVVSVVRYGSVAADTDWTTLLRLWAKNGANGTGAAGIFATTGATHCFRTARRANGDPSRLAESSMGYLFA